MNSETLMIILLILVIVIELAMIPPIIAGIRRNWSDIRHKAE